MICDDLVILDFETTGLSPESGDRVTEVAALRIRKDRVVDQFESLMNCGMKLNPFIVNLTGITQRMVDCAPPPSKVIRELVKFLGGDAVIAHNASFDDRFFRNECGRLAVPESVDPFICSIRIARRVYPNLGSYKLSSIAESLGLKYSGRAHRAAADARLTAEIVLKSLEQMRARREGVRLGSRMLRRFIEMPVSNALAALT
jgi:DNA polymerase-3 subunit epsilon